MPASGAVGGEGAMVPGAAEGALYIVEGAIGRARGGMPQARTGDIRATRCKEGERIDRDSAVIVDAAAVLDLIDKRNVCAKKHQALKPFVLFATRPGAACHASTVYASNASKLQIST